MQIKNMKTKKRKSFYKKNGTVFNKHGIIAQIEMEAAIKKIYCFWIDKGFSQSECAEMLLTQVWHTSNFENAMRS